MLLNLEQEEKDRKLKLKLRLLTDLVKKSRKMSYDEFKDAIKYFKEATK